MRFWKSICWWVVGYFSLLNNSKWSTKKNHSLGISRMSWYFVFNWVWCNINTKFLQPPVNRLLTSHKTVTQGTKGLKNRTGKIVLEKFLKNIPLDYFHDFSWHFFLTWEISAKKKRGKSVQNFGILFNVGNQFKIF